MGFCVRCWLPTSSGVVVRIVVTKRWLELDVETLKPTELVEGRPLAAGGIGGRIRHTGSVRVLCWRGATRPVMGDVRGLCGPGSPCVPVQPCGPGSPCGAGKP